MNTDDLRRHANAAIYGPSEGAAPQRTPPERIWLKEWGRLRNRHENALHAAVAYDVSPHPHDAKLRRKWDEARAVGDALDAHVEALRERYEEAIEALRLAIEALRLATDAAEEMIAVLDSGHDWESLHHTTPERGAYDRVKLRMWDGQRLLARHAESAPRATEASDGN